MKWLMIPLGTTTVALGLVTLWLPIPIGLPLLLLGLLILIRFSVLARRAVAGASRRHSGFRRLFRRLHSLGRRIGRRQYRTASKPEPARPEID